MKRLSKLALVLLACFALVATGCKHGPDVDNNGTNTSQSGSGSGTESGGGSESGDGTQTGGDNTGDQTGGDGSQESGGDTEKGDTGSGESGESGEEGGSTGGETGGQTETVAVTEVKITSSVTEVTADDSITLEVSVSPDNASDKTVTWSSDNEDVATVDSNGVVKGVAAGKATITATVGEKRDSVEIIVNRKVVVGDIILQDLTIVSSEGYTKNESNPAVAVVAGFNKDGQVLGLGLKNRAEVAWAKKDTTGYTTSFKEIITEYSKNTSSGYEFNGDSDGSNNWDYICSIDTEGTDTAKEIAENYPAFNFALNYGTTTCGFDANDELASGWYIPSIVEMYEIYKNKDTVQASLTKVGGFSLSSNWYWSSSQYSKTDSCVDIMLFDDGSVSYNTKSYSTYSLLVVRAF